MKRLEHFQLLRSEGFPACEFRRLSSRLFREDETRDKNVPQTRRQECLRYIKVGTALKTKTTVNNTGQAAAELDAFPPSPKLPTSLKLRWTGRRTGLPAILPASPSFAATGDRAFIRLHPISARREGEL
jgi:hypothetical protein